MFPVIPHPPQVAPHQPAPPPYEEDPNTQAAQAARMGYPMMFYGYPPYGGAPVSLTDTYFEDFGTDRSLITASTSAHDGRSERRSSRRLYGQSLHAAYGILSVCSTKWRSYVANFGCLRWPESDRCLRPIQLCIHHLQCPGCHVSFIKLIFEVHN